MLLNIQCLSKHKIIEIEQLIEKHTLLFLTETQQKFDNTTLNQNFDTFTSMRGQDGKKGGGLMVLYQKQEHIQLQQITSKQKDILIMRGTLKNYKITIVLVYLLVIRNETEKLSNQHTLTEIVNEIKKCSEEELIFVMGDFNAHLGFIGEQETNYNGQLVLDFMTERNMILMNDTDKCSGTTTWSRQSQKSTIDFLLVNNAAYNICSRMQIDEKQEKFDLSDHNLIETTLKMDCDHINYQRRGEWENIEYYKTDEKSIHSFITDLEDNLGKEDNLIPMEDLNMMI